MLCPLKQGSVKILCTTLKEVVLALSYLHHLGIVHGDLKCENVLLKSSTSEHGLIAKVADFGLSRDLRGLDSYYATNISGAGVPRPGSFRVRVAVWIILIVPPGRCLGIAGSPGECRRPPQAT